MKSLLALLFLFSLSANAKILHLELGAGNYGGTDGSPEVRFEILRLTAQDLIRKYGTEGTIYLNDYFPESAEAATQYLRGWLKEQGHTKIEVISLPGDYRQLDLPQVTTLHLANPGMGQLPSIHGNASDNAKISAELTALATHSRTGLKITSYFEESMITLASMTGKAQVVPTGKNGFRYNTPTAIEGAEYQALPTLPTEVYYLFANPCGIYGRFR